MTKRKASVALDTGNESSESSSTHDNSSNSTSATNTTTGTSNNQGTQNGSSATGSCGTRQQQISDNSNGGSQQKSKKERADNWSSAEIQILHRGIETRRDIFYGPPNQATKKNRELAWEAITKEVNSVSTTPRSLSQVMKKFKNEKCRAKRKFIDAEKDGHSNLSNNNTTNDNNNLPTQNHTGSNQQQQSQLQPQQQPHHMTNSETMSSQTSSINIVKLAPQNVAKTMIDLPGHVQQIQMPSDDMVLIVPPDMDGLLSGMNIVSDGNYHHIQKCSGDSTLTNQQHNHHGQHTIQSINNGQSLVNSTMSNGMMTRTIPAGSMCSLVYSTGSEVCGTEQHLANNVSGPNQLSSNHINSQNLIHHRVPVEQNQGQQQHQHQQQQSQHHHHQIHQHQQPSHHHQQQQQQQQQQHQHHQHQSQHPQQPHQPAQHHQNHLQQNHMTSTTTTAVANAGGVAVESQLKNLLVNLLLKDGQHPVPVVNSNQDHNKQRNDMLAIIASSLNKIEGHLSKISKVASSLFAHNMNNNANDNGAISTSLSLNAQTNSLNISNNDGNNNNVSMTGTGTTNTISNQSGTEA